MVSRRDYARLLQPLLPQAAGYARAILKNRHDAEDAVQQAALRGLERIATYDSARPFKGWWYAILRNCCIDMLREANARIVDRLGDYDPPAEEAAEVFDWTRLDAAISQLSEDHREILRLRYFADLSYHELAVALGIPEGTVMSRLYLARKSLATKLPREEL